MMSQFKLLRAPVNGAPVLVAEGVRFDPGFCVLHWYEGHGAPIQAYNDVATVESLECSDGMTTLAWDEPPDIEVRMLSDGNASVVERMEVGTLDYGHNVEQWTMSAAHLTELLKQGGTFETAHFEAKDHTSWYEAPVPNEAVTDG